MVPPANSPWRSLRLQLTLGLALTVVLVSLVLAWVGKGSLERSYTEQVFTNLNSNARSVASLLEKEAELRIRALEALGTGLDARSWSDARKVQVYLDDKPIAATLFRRDIYVISPSGVRIAEFPPRGTTGSDYQNAPYVRQALESGRPQVFPLIGRFSKMPNLIFAVPVRDPQGRLVAILCGSEELKPGSAFYLSDFARNGLQGGYQVYGVKERIIIASSDARRVLQPLPEQPNPLLKRRLEEGYTGPGRAITPDGMQVLSISQHLPNLNWQVVSYASADEAFAPLRAMVRTMWIGAVAACVTVIALSWWLIGRLLQPLVGTAALIARARPEAELPQVPEQGSQEIRLLLLHFNQLHRTVKAQLDALSQERDRLDAAVANRTRELEESQHMLQLVVDNLPGSVAYIDTELRIRFAAHAYAQWFDRTPESIQGADLRELLDAELFALNQPHIEAVLAGQPQHFERTASDREGALRTLWVSYVPDLKDGQVRGYFSFSTDVSALKEAQHQIQQQAAELDDLYNHAPSGYHSLAADGTVLHINDTELAWLGYERDEVIGKLRIADLLTAPSLQTYQDNYPVLLARDELGELKLDFVRKDRSTYPALVSMAVVRDEAGRFVKTRSVCVDFTRLHQQQETLERILTASPMAVRIASLKDRRILFMNQAFCELIQQTEAQARELDVKQFYVDQAAFDRIGVELSQGHPVLNQLFELHLPYKPEAPHVWALASFMVINYMGEPAVLAWIFDVTQLHEARQLAEQSTQAKSQFLANMSHEIRTPLNAILGLTYLLDKQVLEAEARRHLLQLQGAGRTLQAIINDILDFSKIEANRIELEITPFKLSAVLDNVATIMASNASRKALELIVEPPPAAAEFLNGDALRLEQVLVNLTGNAIKFTEQGHVRVGITQLAADADLITLRFTVADTGIGMTPEVQQRIFSPFTQADSSTSRQFGGTGLGLSISRRLVELMGGAIGVTSAPGQGSEFWFTLTVRRAEPPPHAALALSHLNLLIADDNEVALAALRSTATSLGWSAHAVGSGAAAVQRALSRGSRADGEDAYLLDWDMPGMDGLTAARLIREARPDTGEPIIIMVSGRSRDELLNAPGAHLADAVLSKPVTGSAMHDAVVHAIRARQGEQPAQALAVAKSLRLDGLHLLIVDDSELNLEVARQILESEGARVCLADGGRQAVDWLNAHPDSVDLVLMDLQMPDLDGIAATRLIRQNPQLKQLPIVALSAGVLQAQQQAALAAGMAGFIPKPFEVNSAVAAIRMHASRAAAPATPSPAPDQVAPSDTAVPQEAARDQTAPWPGLDLQRGFAVFRDLGRYRTFLDKFANLYRDACQRLAQAEPAEACLLAHSLKGAAATLGINQVAERASALERHYRSGQPTDAGLLAALDAAMAQALASIAGLGAQADNDLGAPGSPAAQSSPSSPSS